MKPSLLSTPAILVALGLAAAALAGCGGGGDTGAGGSGGSGAGGSGGVDYPTPPLEDSCNTVCEKQTAVECAQLTEDQCKGQCPYLEQQLGENCVPEYKAYYGCLASLEYGCTNGYPVPVDQTACTGPATAVQECASRVPCVKYCEAAAATGCGTKNDEACVDACMAETTYQSGDSDCYYEVSQLVSCQGGTDAEHLDCKGGQLVTVGCDTQVQDYAECVQTYEGDWCEGYCQATTLVGCAPGGIETCLLDCQEAKHAGGDSCTYYYENLLQCRIGQGITCAGGAVSDAGCEDPLASYETCVNP